MESLLATAARHTRREGGGACQGTSSQSTTCHAWLGVCRAASYALRVATKQPLRNASAIAGMVTCPTHKAVWAANSFALYTPDAP